MNLLDGAARGESDSPHAPAATDGLRSPDLFESKMSQSIAAGLFFRAFSNVDVPESVGRMDQGGVTAQLFPEFERGRNLTLDERWHGDDTVGMVAHRLLAAATHCAAASPLPRPHYNTLLFMAAFLGQIGRKPNELQDCTHAKLPRDGRRYELGPRDSEYVDDGFRRVRFSAYERWGARTFLERVTELNSSLEATDQFTQGELAMAALWIKFMGRPLQMARQFDPTTLEAQCRYLLSQLFANELLNERIPASEVVHGFIHLARARYEVAHPRKIENRDPTKDWQKWQEIWELEGLRLQEVFSVLRRGVPALEQESNAKLIVPLVGGDDWYDLQITPARRRAAKIYAETNGALFADREDALRSVAGRFSERPATELPISRIAHERPGYREGSARFFGVTRNARFDDPEGRFTVDYYDAVPLRQFTPDAAPHELAAHLRSHSYPAIGTWLAQLSKLGEKNGIDILGKLVSEGPFANLPELEAYLTRHTVNPLDVAAGFASQAKLAEITAWLPEGPRTVAIRRGFQSTLQKGSGFAHVMHQRFEELRRFYISPGESEKAMSRRFLENGLCFVAGTARLELPSAHDPDRFTMLVGALPKTDQFLTLTLDRLGHAEPRSFHLVTSFFHRDPGHLRSDLRLMLKNLPQGVRMGASYETANEFLSKYGQKPLKERTDNS